MANVLTPGDSPRGRRLVWGNAMRLAPNLGEERALWLQGLDLVAGVDEVGRGPLAGPVVAGAGVRSPSSDFRWLFPRRGRGAPAAATRPAARSPPRPSSPRWPATATCGATTGSSPATASRATRATLRGSTWQRCAAWDRARFTAAPSRPRGRWARAPPGQ